MNRAIPKRHIAREWSLRIFLLSFSLIVALGLAEVLARVFLPITDGRENVTMDGVPIQDWFEPGMVYRQVSNEYDAVTTITEKGHRVPGAQGNPEVIFVGDSFTYGFGLSDDETFAGLYCKHMQRACVNLGIPGSGTLKQLERLETFIDQWGWRPKEVKWFFFGMSGSFSAGNDFVDNYDRYVREHAAPISDKQGSARQAISARPEGSMVERIIGWQEAILGHSTLMRRAKFYWGPMLKSLVVADPGKDRMATALLATKESFSRLDALSRRVGFDYTIYLIVPVQDVIRGTYGETLRALNSVTPKPAVATAELYLENPQQFYFAFDGHINVEGSRRIADFLLKKDQANADVH
jgi:hypothetical protein